jgi:hypothetical protein
MKAPRALGPLLLVSAVLVLAGCRSGPSEGWSSRARTMILASGPTEIVYASSKVPGYLAVQAYGGDEFFLYTRDRSFEKGSRVAVEGPFGLVYASVFFEGSRVYERDYQIFILTVWKIKRSENAPRP